MKKFSALLCLLATSGFVFAACNGEPLTVAGPTSTSIFFKDDFSNNSSGWNSVEESRGITNYYDKGYRIQVNTPSYYLWGRPSKLSDKLSDVSIEVDAARMAGPTANDMGIICRYQNEANFYILAIGSDGHFAISKYKDGVEELVGMQDVGLDESAIQPDKNHLRADCVGDTLSLYANGKLLRQVKDSDFSSGSVGLIAGAYEVPGVDVIFDNFTMRQP